MKKFLRPTWAEISIHTFRHNLTRIKHIISPHTKLLMVVKANAYGHGAVSLSRAAVRTGVSMLGVSSVEEGITLRMHGIKAPILILGSLYPFSSINAAVTYRLIPTVASLESARALSRIGRKKRKKILFHFKIDTGMRRIGIYASRACEILQNIVRYPYIQLDGVYTHLAQADTGRVFTREQLTLFDTVRDCLDKQGIHVRWYHAANSAGTERFPESRYAMVRIGLAAYGLYNSREPAGFRGLKPVLSWKTKIVYIKWLPTNTRISYGGTYRTKRISRIATLPVGYADGYSRMLSNCGEVLIRGRRCPVVGRVTMDMLMVDVTDVAHARIGDTAVLLGSQGTESITADDIAAKTGTISYEVVCAISSRVPRVEV